MSGGVVVTHNLYDEDDESTLAEVSIFRTKCRRKTSYKPYVLTVSLFVFIGISILMILRQL